MSARPYLSIVATSRNDNHGGTLTRRMQTFVNALIRRCRRHRLPAELIIVEWNPPVEREPLASALSWPDDGGYCPTRLLQVSRSLHEQFQHSSALPLYQMIAKNVGIRRSQSPFILVTNIDILFSEELFELLSRQALEQRVLYRLDRHDIQTDAPVDADLDALMDYCRSHLLRLNANDGIFTLTSDGVRASRLHAEREIPSNRRNLELIGEWYWPETHRGIRYRWAGNHASLRFHQPVAGTLLLDLEPGAGVGYGPCDLTVTDNLGRQIAQRRVWGRQRVAIPLIGNVESLTFQVANGGKWDHDDPRIMNFLLFGIQVVSGNQRPTSPLETLHWSSLPRLYAKKIRRWAKSAYRAFTGQPTVGPFPHTNACGDFQLMDRESWFDLQGYYEWQGFSMHLDTLLAFHAHYAGIREVVLRDPMRIYHIEHNAGSGFTPEGAEKLAQRLQAAGIPMLNDKQVRKLVERRRRGVLPEFVQPNWGMAGLDLPETIIRGGSVISTARAA